MIYVIRKQSFIQIIYEGIEQKLFEIDNKIVHPLYPVDNLIGYLKEVEKVYKKSRNKNLVDVLRQVDSSCADCMLVGEAEAGKSSKLNYNQELKNEIHFVGGNKEIRNLHTPFQISYADEGKTQIFYPDETEIIFVPRNYKNFFGKFSHKANKRNAKTYEIMKRYTELFGNAYCAIQILYFVTKDAYYKKIPSFKKFEKVCEKMLDELEYNNEKFPYLNITRFYGKRLAGHEKGIVPPHVESICNLEKALNLNSLYDLDFHKTCLWGVYTDTTDE